MSDYLPLDLISNILPIHTLLRCTSVCKSWYSLITSSSFISSHLKLSLANNQNRLLIRFYTDYYEIEHYNVHLDNQTLEQVAKLDCPITTSNSYLIVGSFNGLLCLFDYNISRIMLWNPSIRKSLTLPKLRLLHVPHAVGFGFLPKTNDYKIVRILYLHEDGELQPKVEVDIYELSTGSWREINAGDFSYIIPERAGASQGFLNGIVHWYTRNPSFMGGSFSELIVSFDMTSEKFGALMVPSFLENEDGILKVCTFRESLCLIQRTHHFCSIWVMREYGVAESWTLQFKIDVLQHPLVPPFYFRQNGGILAKHYDGSLFSYDSINNKVMKFEKWRKRRGFCVETYMESLVLINSPNEVLGSKGDFEEYMRVVAELDNLTVEETFKE